MIKINQAFGILDEMIIGGEIMETSKNIILGALRNVELLEWSIKKYNK